MRLIFYRYLYIFVYMRLLKISVDTEEGGEVNQLGKGGETDNRIGFTCIN